MKKFKMLGLISFALIGVGALASIPFAITSCSKKPNTPPGPEPITTDYNTEGTNWPGYGSGTLELQLYIGNGETIGEATIAVNNLYTAADLVIPDYVTDGTNIYAIKVIDSSVFEQTDPTSPSLTGNLTIGNQVVNIGDSAFKSCTGLTGTLTIPNSVMNIGEYAFNGDTGFTGLTIGNHVNEIGGYAFKDCDGLIEELTIPGNVQTIEEHAFDGCTKIEGNLTIEYGVRHIANMAFSSFGRYRTSTNYYTLIIPNSLIEVGDNAFSSCNKFNLIKASYASQPSWSGNNIFQGSKQSGTVNNDNNVYLSAQFLAFLIGKGLNRWIAG